MKIAIPYAEEQVFQHFNEASQFKIYTVDEFDILEEELVSISQDTPAQTAAALKAQGGQCGDLRQHRRGFPFKYFRTLRFRLWAAPTGRPENR